MSFRSKELMADVALGASEPQCTCQCTKVGTTGGPQSPPSPKPPKPPKPPRMEHLALLRQELRAQLAL